MSDFRLRRPAAGKPARPDLSARVSEIVGRNLRDIRRRQRHSLDTLAAASGVSRAMLGQIETGKSVPTITVLWKVAAALGVPVADLITDPDVPNYTLARRSKAVETGVAPVPFVSRPVGAPHPQAGYVFEELSLGPGHREAFPAKRDGGIITLVVAAGSLEVAVAEGAPLDLAQGDSIQFSSGLKHSLANWGPQPAIIYLVAGSPRNGR